mgnify:CR=1 FL=1
MCVLATSTKWSRCDGAEESPDQRETTEARSGDLVSGRETYQPLVTLLASAYEFSLSSGEMVRTRPSDENDG